MGTSDERVRGSARMGTSELRRALLVVFGAAMGMLILASCLARPDTPVPTPTADTHTLTPAHTPIVQTTAQPLFQTYALGELLPDMRVPMQRSAKGEGGWYVVIGSAEGWAQFLSRMGQPAEIWEPVQWKDEIVIGALLGARQGRGWKIAISDLVIDGLNAVAQVVLGPAPEAVPPSWVTYPFHLVRVPRQELPLGLVTFRFAAEDRILAEQAADMVGLDIAWLPGEASTLPTATPILSTSTPEPTVIPTPVPHLRVVGMVLETSAAVSNRSGALQLHIVSPGSPYEYVELLEGTSIFSEGGRPVSLAQIVPGTTIAALGYAGQEGSIRAAHIDILRLPTQEPSFAPYRPRTVSLSTIYDGYALPLPEGGISATVPITQAMNLTQTHALTRSGFIVVPSTSRSFADQLLAAQQSGAQGDASEGYPLFISTDSVLHVSQLLFDQVQRSTERLRLLPELTMLDQEMFSLSWEQYRTTKGQATPEGRRVAAAAWRNAAYFAVPLALLDPGFTAPAEITAVVSAELSLIAAGKGITVSPLFDLPGMADPSRLRVDYAQFVPTGPYARDEESSRYFRAVTWHRLIAFRPEQREETLSSALIAYLLQTHSAPRVLWERIHAVQAFFQGQDASFTAAEYVGLVAAVWGEEADVTALADEGRMDTFLEAVRALPLPDHPMWTIWATKQPIVRDWRFLSPSFHIDTYLFGQLTGDYVGDADAPRALPSCIDLAATLGSLEAYRIAAQTGDTNYTNYVDQVDRVRNELSTLRPANWTSDLYWNWLYIYRALVQDKNASYPGWMRTAAWKRKDLQTMFGSWTQVRHDADLNGAPLSTGMAGGGAGRAGALSSGGNEVRPTWGYVEPQPEVYARLAALTRLIIDGLEDRLLLADPERGALLNLETWLSYLQDTARRELIGRTLTDQEYQRLADYGSLVDEITQLAAKASASPEDQTPGAGYDEAVAVAVAVSGAGAQREYLVEAIGQVDTLYVVVERDQYRYLARGGVYSHYEWRWTGPDPLSDERWREMLDARKAPPLPLWVQGIVVR